MASLNKVMLIGNLTRDPQLKYLPSQTAVAEFGLAVNRKFKSATGESREEVCFVDITAFGKTAETMNQYLTKGKPVFIEGRLKFDSWEDKNGGGKRSKLTVVVDNFQFLGGPGGPGGPGGQGEGGGNYDSGGGEDPGPPPQRSAPRPQAQRPQGAPPQRQQPPAQQDPPFTDEQQFKEDDIPF
jgi:single-strand DNA-binding protein